MYAWSDWDPPRRPASGAALQQVLRPLVAPEASVLVAGPHDDRLLWSLVDAGATVTQLIRGVLDAQRLATEFPGIRVLCGGLADIEGAPRFDVVVAAAGLARLSCVE